MLSKGERPHDDPQPPGELASPIVPKRFGLQFRLRSLLWLTVGVALALWLIYDQWGRVLVWVHADALLVPAGIAIYSPHTRESSSSWWPEEYQSDLLVSDRAAWVSKTCTDCHKMPGPPPDPSSQIAFPMR